MKILSISAALFGVGLMVAGPVVAQTAHDKAAPAQNSAAKQPTDGGPSDGGFNTGPASGATSGPGFSATKQRSDGGPSDGGFYTGPGSKAVPKQQ
jgi:hypothetical protein